MHEEIKKKIFDKRLNWLKRCNRKHLEW